MTSKRSWKLQEFVGHSSMVTCAALGHKSGRVLATGGEDGKVNTWHLGSPNCIMSLSSLSNAVEVVRFNSSEEYLCAGSRSGALRIWDLGASKVIRQLAGHKAAVRSLDFHPYGDFIVSGAVDHKVRMWDIRRKGCIFTYKGHEGEVNAVEFSPDGRWISSVSDDRTCKIWNITAGKLLHELKDHSAGLSCLQFHPNEVLLATGSYDRTSIVYDVEKIAVVSRSGLEASPILHVMFDDSGKYLYTASQDCCKLYSWEPSFVHLDTVIVKWGKPADIALTSDRLMGCSYSQNVVSVHIIDTEQLSRTSSSDLSVENQLVHDNTPRLRHPSNQRPQDMENVNSRPPSSVDVNQLSPKPKENHCKNNNTDVSFQNIDADDETRIFKPTATLARSPSKDALSPTSQKKPLGVKGNNLESKLSGEPINVHTSPTSNNGHLRTVMQPSNGPSNISQQNRISEAADTPNKGVVEIKQKFVSMHMKNAPQPLGGALNWLDQNQVPTRDNNIPEKPDTPTSSSLQSQQSSDTYTVQSFVSVPQIPQGSLARSTLVPNDRQDPIGLDMNAFLPAKRDHGSTSSTKKSDVDAIAEIKKGIVSMRVMLTNRHKNLEIVRALWTSGDIMTSINAAVKMEDQALMVDLLNVLTLKPTLWSLDLCVVMLPQIRNLIISKHETYTSVGCHSLKLVLKNFAQVIRSNLKTPPNAVDISREERHHKCKSCHSVLCLIKKDLESKQQTSGKIGSQFRELKILLNTLE